jgi:hypothetical protein
VLQKAAHDAGVEVITKAKVSAIHPPRIKDVNGRSSWNLQLAKPLDGQQQLVAEKVLIATGSDAKLWASIGAMKHDVVPAVPSLFTFKVDDPLLESLSGIVINPAMLSSSVYNGPSSTVQGPVLITHGGISGPAVLRLSAFAAREMHQVFPPPFPPHHHSAEDLFRSFDLIIFPSRYSPPLATPAPLPVCVSCLFYRTRPLLSLQVHHKFPLRINFSGMEEDALRLALHNLPTQYDFERKTVGAKAPPELAAIPRRLYKRLCEHALGNDRSRWGSISNEDVERLVQSFACHELQACAPLPHHHVPSAVATLASGHNYVCSLDLRHHPHKHYFVLPLLPPSLPSPT